MRLPITIPLEGVTLEGASRALAGEPGFACIDARGAPMPAGRFSLAAAFPLRSFSIAGGFVTIDGHTTIDTPYAALRRFCAEAAEWPADPYLPFSGGIIGTIGFEGARAIRGFDPARDFSRHSQCRLGLYAAAALFDHIEGTARIVGGGADRGEAEVAVRRLLDRIGRGAGAPVSPATAASDAAGCRREPPPEVFRTLIDAARSWIRAERAERLHLVRRTSRPAEGGAALDRFFSMSPTGSVRALFTHEAASYLVESSELLLSAERGRVRTPVDAADLSPVDALVAVLPVEAMAGAPFDRALEFIERHEGEHRFLYGGAFGVLDAGRATFRPIRGVQVIADGMLSVTAGADLTVETDSATVLQEIERRFSEMRL